MPLSWVLFWMYLQIMAGNVNKYNHVCHSLLTKIKDPIWAGAHPIL